MKLTIIKIFIVTFSVFFNSCTLKHHYYLVNTTERLYQFQLPQKDKSAHAIYEFTYGKTTKVLNRRTHKKYRKSIGLTVLDIEGSNYITGYLPPDSTIYFGFGVGTSKLIEYMIINSEDTRDTIYFADLEKKGRILYYEID
jgi:hypothetical protein